MTGELWRTVRIAGGLVAIAVSVLPGLSACKIFLATAFPDGGGAQGAPVAEVTMSPGPGRIGHSVGVTLSCATPGATIAYTLDGSAPRESGGSITQGSRYTSPLILPYGATTLRAMAFKLGCPDSPVTANAYTQTVFVYAASQTNWISAYGVDPMTGALATCSGAPFAASYPTLVVADSLAKFLFVAFLNNRQIVPYTINPDAGALTMQTPVFMTPYYPMNMAYAPMGRFLYTSCYAMGPPVTQNIYGFSVSSAGALTSLGMLYTLSVGNATGLVVHPDRPILYLAASASPGQIQRISIDTVTGALTLLDSVTTEDTYPQRVAIDSRGRFLFAVESGTGTIETFSIASSDGSLTSVSSLAIGASYNPLGAVVDPSGRFLYIADDITAGSVHGFAIGAGGTLTPVPLSPFAAGNSPCSLSVDPSGHFLYVVNTLDGTLSDFRIDSSTGTLTPVGSAVALPAAPACVLAIGPQ